MSGALLYEKKTIRDIRKCRDEWTRAKVLCGHSDVAAREFEDVCCLRNKVISWMFSLPIGTTTVSLISRSAGNDESAFSVVIDRTPLQLLSRRSSLRVVCLENGQRVKTQQACPRSFGRFKPSRAAPCLFERTINKLDGRRRKEGGERERKKQKKEMLYRVSYKGS